MDANGGYNEEILQVDRTLNRRIANHRGSRLFDLDTVHVQTDEATQYAEEGKVVDNRLEFGETTSKVGIILYPGAKVEKEAYAYDGTRLAEEGYLVAIPSFRLNLGIERTTRRSPISDSRMVKKNVRTHIEVRTF